MEISTARRGDGNRLSLKGDQPHWRRAIYGLSMVISTNTSIESLCSEIFKIQGYVQNTGLLPSWATALIPRGIWLVLVLVCNSRLVSLDASYVHGRGGRRHPVLCNTRAQKPRLLSLQHCLTSSIALAKHRGDVHRGRIWVRLTVIEARLTPRPHVSRRKYARPVLDHHLFNLSTPYVSFIACFAFFMILICNLYAWVTLTIKDDKFAQWDS